MKNNYLFNMSDVPYGWPMCFNNECAKKNECLRYCVGEKALDLEPAAHETGICVTPAAYRDGECRKFFSIKTERVAWGFSHIYDKVLKIHYSEIIAEIKQYVHGGTNYYRYANGQKKLNEHQQQWIADLFSKYGYTDPVEFDHYEDKVTFQP